MGVKRKPVLFLLLVAIILSSAMMQAQVYRQAPASEEEAYGSKFFNQLRSLFGRFLDSDLQRSFQDATPIDCSELISNKGEWRPVAFFNEDRSLGEWCRNSLEEVKSDLTVFTFKGPCRGERGSIQMSSEFPVDASVQSYNRGEIDLNKVDVTVNPPVNAVFDIRTGAYAFDLPYLFLTGQRGSMKVYSLAAPTVNDAYARDVTSSWECKAVKSSDVTYRFLICRTSTIGRNSLENVQNRRAFGASAFFILSDGMETHTSVNMSFGDARILLPDEPKQNPAAPPAPGSAPARTAPQTEPAAAPVRLGPPVRILPAAPEASSAKNVETAPTGDWKSPEPQSKLNDSRKKFRLRFSPQTWNGKIDAPQILIDQRVVPLPARPREGSDYCAWHPGTSGLAGNLLSNAPELSLRYIMGGFDKSVQSPASFVFDLKTDSGILLGKLQCYFARTAFADDILFDRWVSIVGGNIALETLSKK
jgi:hypothetical protein